MRQIKIVGSLQSIKSLAVPLPTYFARLIIINFGLDEAIEPVKLNFDRPHKNVNP